MSNNQSTDNSLLQKSSVQKESLESQQEKSKDSSEEPSKKISSSTPSKDSSEEPSKKISSSTPSKDSSEEPSKKISSSPSSKDSSEEPSKKISSSPSSKDSSEEPSREISSSTPSKEESSSQESVHQESAESSKKLGSGLFQKYISQNKIFKNREVLRHSYNPRELPHRDEQINSIAEILAPALQGSTPSNILIYGKTGTGKTATVKYVGRELETESSEYSPCRLVHLNCETIDTQYRVLAQIANYVSSINLKPGDQIKNTIPPTGWHTDQVYSELKNILEQVGGLLIIVLDEIDKLVKKSGDATLYSLTRINSDLIKSRVCIIGISNDLAFKDFLDPRVLSSLSEEELVFPPYDANQLRDILYQRAKSAFIEGAVSDEIISLCAARAAQEHGDARRALDLLRVSGELADREGKDHIEEYHVAAAQDNIETDTMSECIKTLPVQSKIVLCSMLLLAGSGQKVFTSSSVITLYRELVTELDMDMLSYRRVTDLINDLTMLGIVFSRTVSYGRHGRTTEIYFKNPTNEIRKVVMNEPRFADSQRLATLMKGN